MLNHGFFVIRYSNSRLAASANAPPERPATPERIVEAAFG